VTTTILGTFQLDTDRIINVDLEYPETFDFGPKEGGYNVLNIPGDAYDPETFWEEYNRPWLEAATQRGDDIYLATSPAEENLYRDEENGVLSGFGREVRYLESQGYVYNPETGRMELLG